MNLDFYRHFPFSRRTTLGVGGPARYWTSCDDLDTLRGALRFARERGLPTCILGGGSNVLVADEGFDGLVIRLGDRRMEIDDTRVVAGAGADWDKLVALTVDAGLVGIEAMSGIPGRVGAAPMQNVGAYGQEVAETIETVETIDRTTGELRIFRNEECGFAYRDSHFKSKWKDRYVVVRVTLRLHRGPVSVRYGELARRLEINDAAPSPAQVREAVLELRRGKSMVLDDDDPNRRSAGSFFTNPIVSPDLADRARAVYGDPSMPAFPTEDGRVKLSAAWLMERSGFVRGFRLGRAALSSNHCLALINPGDATAADLVALAAHVRRGVRDACGVTLYPEPVFVGFDDEVDEILDRVAASA